MSEVQLMVGSARTSKASQARQVEEQPFYDDDEWYVIHNKNRSKRYLYAVSIRKACSNDNLVYSQDKRAEIYANGIDAKKLTHCDCSSLVREIVLMGGTQVPDWYTGSMISICEKCDEFEVYKLNHQIDKLWNGDILVYRKNGHGHTVIVSHGGKVNKKSKKNK